jgi:hypothetical protein
LRMHLVEWRLRSNDTLSDSPLSNLLIEDDFH